MHVYDKAKYHSESVLDFGLPEEHATHHTLFFLRWLIEQGLVSDEFRTESGDALERMGAGAGSAYELFEWWDNCLIDEMLNDEGNAFASAYFDFDHGAYLSDYARALQKDAFGVSRRIHSGELRSLECRD